MELISFTLKRDAKSTAYQARYSFCAGDRLRVKHSTHLQVELGNLGMLKDRFLKLLQTLDFHIYFYIN